MHNEIVIFLAYVTGFFALVFCGRLLMLPFRIIGRLLVSSVIGAGIIAIINIFGNVFGLCVPMNPLNALIVGILGIPGSVFLLLFLN